VNPRRVALRVGAGLALVAACLFPGSCRPPRIAVVSPQDTTGTLNILIVGKDARALRPANDSGTGRVEREKLSHSDIVIVCHINFGRRVVNLVALPRDLLVEVPGYTHAASRTDFTRMEKLTHAFVIGGEPLLRRTVENLLGIKIDRCVAFDFDSFRMVFDLLRPLLGRLSVQGNELTDRDEALRFARQRNGLRYDDLDRCRNAVAFIRTVAVRCWRFAGTAIGDRLLEQAWTIIGTDTDLALDSARRLLDGLRLLRFDPHAIKTAVLVSEGRPVTLFRYEMTLSCYLPQYEEIERQTRHYLMDSTDIPAMDFMTQQPYRWLSYFMVDYDSLPAPDSLLPGPDSAPGVDSARLATRLAELRAAKGDTLH
jgi:hypothetical protein